MNTIEVWHPRYHDNVVLLAKYKVGSENCVVFTKAQNLLGKQFFILGTDVKQYPLETNGKISCYAVSMDALVPLEEVA